MQSQTCRQHNDYLSDMESAAYFFAPMNTGCDSRYRSIVNKLDVMIDLVQQQPGYNMTNDLDRLLDSMMDHFCSENTVLKLVDFPQAMNHRLHHYSIFTDTAEMRHLFNKGENVLPDRLPKIRQLCLEHISVHDRAFEEFLVN